MAKKKELLIVGTIPDTAGIGGVSIHVKRLMDFLDIRRIKYKFVDYKINSVGSILKAITHCDVLHLHISNPKALFVFTLWGRLIGKTVIVTLHGNYGRFVSLNKKLIQSVIKNASVPVVINENSFDACKKINKQTILLSAFIPPQKEENLNEEVQSVIADAKARGKQIVSTNAFNISYDKDGNETYGIGFLLDFFENSDFTFLFSDPTGNYRKQYSNDYKNTLFITQPHSYFEVLKKVDFFIRNTSTDGDAISVKEALFLGVETICTDVVSRPEGCILFQYCDRDTLTMALTKANTITNNSKIANAAEQIAEVYEEYGIES